jgi:hypothetical protein
MIQMSEAMTPELFEQLRNEFVLQRQNPNTNRDPVPYYVIDGRMFLGLGAAQSAK